jgi:outer membrane lipopolysaccharide assembly protein LptE/RlpB
VEVRASRFNSAFRIWLTTLLLAVACGCGYQFTSESSFLPKDVKTLYIEQFVNRSRDVGIEKELVSALRSEFYRKGQLKVVDQIEQADAILSGVVRAVDYHVSTVNRRDEALQYEGTMIVDVMLRRRDPDGILWQSQGVRLSRIYAGSRAAIVTTSSEFLSGTAWSFADVARLTDIQLTEAANKRARDELFMGFAEDLRQRLTEMF